MAIIDELIAILGYDVRGEGELRRFNAGLDRAEQHARGVARRFDMLSVAVGSFVGTLASSMFLRLTDTLGSLPGEVIAVGSTFEKLETTLTTIEGSGEKARAALDWVEKFAKTTPYDLNQVAEAFVRLRAYGLDPMSGQLETIGNASSAMGKSLMAGVEAIADAASGENERLKEFGIRSKVEGDKITYNWQQNGKEMSKTVRKNGTEIVAALMEIFSRFDGAMDAQSKTMEGLTSNLGDTWTNFLKRIGEKGYYDDIKRRLQGVLDTVGRWEKDGTLDRLAQGFSDFLTGTINALTRVGRSIYRLGSWIVAGFEQIGKGIADALRWISSDKIDLSNWEAFAAAAAALFAWFFPLTATIVAAGLAIDDFLTYLEGGESVIGDFINGLPDFVAAFDQIAPGVRSAVQSTIALLQAGDWTGAGIMAVEAYVRQWEAIGNLILPYFERAKSAVLNVDWSGLADRVIADVVGGLDTLGATVGNALLSGLETLTKIDAAGLGEALGSDATQIGMRIGGLIVTGLIWQFGKINEFFNGLVDRLVALDWSRIGVALFNALKWQVELIVGMFRGIADQIRAAVLDWFDIDLSGAGARLAQSLWEGFKSYLPSWDSFLWGDAANPNFDSREHFRVENAINRDRPRSIARDNPILEDRATRFRPDGGTVSNMLNGMDQLRSMLNNMNGNLARMTPAQAVEATITDARQDNRAFPMTVNSTVNQTVTQATNAPLQAAQATSKAVGQAAVGQAARIEQEPAF